MCPLPPLVYNERHHSQGFCRVELQKLFFVFVVSVFSGCFPCLWWHWRRVLRELYGCPGYILTKVWESGGISGWKQCWMTLRCDYAGNDMRRCNYAGNGLNFRSLRGQGYIWQPFGSYLSVVSQQPTTVVSRDNEPEHLHIPQLPTATSEGGTAGCFSDKEGSRFSFGGWNRGRAELWGRTEPVGVMGFVNWWGLLLIQVRSGLLWCFRVHQRWKRANLWIEAQ